MFCLSNFCCICLKTNLEYRDISSLDSDDISLKQKLNFCAFKQDYLTDEIPLKICVKCYIELRIAYKFRKTCLRNNEFLKEYIFELKHALSENCSYSHLYVNLFDDFNTKSVHNDYEDVVEEEYLTTNDNLTVLEDSFTVDDKTNIDYNNSEYIKLKNEIYNDIFNEDCKEVIVVPSSDEESSNEDKNKVLSNSITICDTSSSTETVNLEQDFTDSSDNIPLSKLIKMEDNKSTVNNKTNYLSDDAETVILQNNQTEIDVGNNLLLNTSIDGNTNTKNNEDNSFLSDISSNCSFFDRNDDNNDSEKKTDTTTTTTNTFENCLQLNKETANTIPESDGKLRCYICNVDFTDKNLLKWHLNIHKDFTSAFIESISQKIDEDKFKCTICKADFSKEILLKWHMKIHEFVLSEHAFKCHLCPERFKRKMQLTFHLKNEHEHVLENKCDVCMKLFASRKTLLAHKNFHHKNKEQKTTRKWFRCNFCSAGFFDKENLIKHRRKHTDNKKFACNVCDKKFPYKSSLLRHLTSHNIIREKKFHCTYCPKSFEHRNTLSTHIKFHQDTGKIFYCTICIKYFADKESLNEHVAKHSKNYRYKCEICGKSMVHARSLKLHVLLHKSERKFKCNICNKGFKLRIYLSNHMKSHAENRQKYECKECGVKMNLKNLRRHAVLHTNLRLGLRPYQCKICGKSYGRKDILNVHMKSTHPNDE